MDTVKRLSDLSDHLENLETAADWIAGEMETTDEAVAKAAALIAHLADEIRAELCQFVRDLERGEERDKLH